MHAIRTNCPRELRVAVLRLQFGQRAAPGAIERVRIDRETLEPRVRVIGTDAWSDDAAFAGTTPAPSTAMTARPAATASATTPAPSACRKWRPRCPTA